MIKIISVIQTILMGHKDTSKKINGLLTLRIKYLIKA